MARERVYFYVDSEQDAELLAWLEQQSNRSEAIRQALRAHMNGQPAAGSLDEAQLRRVLREELSRVATLAASAPPPASEDDELKAALDDLAGAWSFEGATGA